MITIRKFRRRIQKGSELLILINKKTELAFVADDDCVVEVDLAILTGQEVMSDDNVL